MFKKILVALDHSKADAALLPRVKELAQLTGAELLLLHVSTGWAAQWQRKLNLSDSAEIHADRDYLQTLQDELSQAGFKVSSRLATGRPSDEILKSAREESCDLIAMTTHGHRLLEDLVHGATITRVRHESEVPIFLVKAWETGGEV
ncbi:MAG TPA: universal stress protein [Terriglobia bacterium]|nr:universal stress protein [Terriglobia bacterium]